MSPVARDASYPAIWDGEMDETVWIRTTFNPAGIEPATPVGCVDQTQSH